MKFCIIGNGLSSLILAKNLADKKIYIDLFFTPNKTNKPSSRTIGITENNLKILEDWFPRISKKGFKINKINIFTERNLKNEILSFKSDKYYQFSVFEYSKLYKFLLSEVLKNSFIKKVSLDRKIKIYSEKFIKKYDIIVDTEIKNKFIKHKFSKKIYKDYDSKAFVTIFSHQRINNNVADQIFTNIGPLAFLPISDTKTSVVFSIYNKAEIDKNKFKKILFKYNLKYKIKKINKVENFSLKLSLLRSYIYKNILVFGDKLHTIHPLAGQGFNMTIRDVKILSNIIDEKLLLGYPIQNGLLNEFEIKARYKNIIFSNTIDLVNEIFKFEKKLPDKISSNLFKVFRDSKILPKYLSHFANKGM